ncbi:MAG: hypothetical protein AAGJ86_11965 [Pseudomonadota bacterium]
MTTTFRYSAFTAAFAIGACLLLTACPGNAQMDDDDSPPEAAIVEMTVDRIESIVARLDDNYQRNENSIAFSFADRDVLIIADPTADRMRVMTPVNAADALDPEELYRLLQANFDSALDARYAIANDMLWSTFIHPLATLSDEELLSGIGQTLNVADTFGTTYSSGAMVFGGGDSNDLQRRALIDELQKRGRETT